jgi:Cupin superfamily protein
MLSVAEFEEVSSAVGRGLDRLCGTEASCAEVVESAVGPAIKSLAEEFLTAMNTHNLPAGQVRVVLDGVRVPPYHYSISRRLKVAHAELIDRAILHRYMQRGATVMLDDAQTAIPILDRLCTWITSYSGMSCAATIFASPPQADGFALHQDAEDVVIVQMAGSKSWTVFPSLARRQSSMLKESECGTPVFRSLLRAGDMLLLPKGSPHKTASDGSAGSIHMTLGLYPVTLRALLVKFIEDSPDTRLDQPISQDESTLARLVDAWLAAPTDRDYFEDKVPDLASIAQVLRTRLRGDAREFRLPELDSDAAGGTYRLLTSVSEATYLVLAARLGREREELSALLSTLAARQPGDTFTYAQFSKGQRGAVVEEVLHEMLRMRFVVQVWS